MWRRGALHQVFVIPSAWMRMPICVIEFGVALAVAPYLFPGTKDFVSFTAWDDRHADVLAPPNQPARLRLTFRAFPERDDSQAS